jgi:hypothetical protein
MRALISMTLLAAASAYAQDFLPAKVMEAQSQVDPLSACQTALANTVVVQIDDMLVRALYCTLGGRRAADLVIGDSVDAAIDGRKLIIRLPDGKTVKADIVRRERVVQENVQ